MFSKGAVMAPIKASLLPDYPMRMRIVYAVNEAVETIPIEHLSVTSICKIAGISRPTFYRYFSDKYEIGQWYWNVLAQEYLIETGRTLSSYEGNYLMLQCFYSFKSFFCNAFKLEGYNSIHHHGARLRRQSLMETIRDFKNSLITEELQFQIDFLVIAEPALVSRWVLEGMKIPPSRLATLIEEAMPRGLHEILNQ
jgi:AcrR family transcriptional regulator